MPFDITTTWRCFEVEQEDLDIYQIILLLLPNTKVDQTDMLWYPFINTAFHNLLLGSFIFGSRSNTTKLICRLVSYLTYIIDWYDQFYGTTDGWNLVSSSSLQLVSWGKLLSAQVQCELTFWAEKHTVAHLGVKKWMIFLLKQVASCTLAGSQ